jgi:hypothetical protein
MCADSASKLGVVMNQGASTIGDERTYSEPFLTDQRIAFYASVDGVRLHGFLTNGDAHG